MFQYLYIYSDPHAVVEIAERFAAFGISGNLINYLNNVLGMPISSAAKNVNIWLGVSTAVTPVLGAFVADSYLGRFKTILFSSIIYLLVHFSITTLSFNFQLHISSNTHCLLNSRVTSRRDRVKPIFEFYNLGCNIYFTIT